jgi:quercetin dioxygenase-like cupin family protein
MTFEFAHSSHDEPPIRIPAIGLELFVRLPPKLSGGTLTIIDTINAPGFGPPLHRHAETEIFRVLSGRYLFETDGKRFHAEPGDVVTVPGGAAHAFVNITDAPARQTIVIVPGLDAAAFFTQLGQVMKQAMKNGLPDAAPLNAFGRDWGVEFLGPPLKPML